MLGFPTKTINYIKNLLIHQQKQVEKNLKGVEKDDPVNDGALVESSEPGTDSYIADTHTKILILEKQLKDTKTSISQALSKIKNGTYGKCEKCGKRIEIARLLAMPTAKLCLACSKKALVSLPR